MSICGLSISVVLFVVAIFASAKGQNMTTMSPPINGTMAPNKDGTMAPDMKGTTAPPVDGTNAPPSNGPPPMNGTMSPPMNSNKPPMQPKPTHQPPIDKPTWSPPAGTRPPPNLDVSGMPIDIQRLYNTLKDSPYFDLRRLSQMDVRRVLGIIKNMKKVDKDVALNITNRIEELVPARVQSMPLELFLLFSDATLNFLKESFTEGQRDGLCRSVIAKKPDSKILGIINRMVGNRCVNMALSQGFGGAGGNPGAKPSESFSRQLVDQLRESAGSAQNWDASQVADILRNVPGGLKKDDIRNMNAAALRENIQNGTLNGQELQGRPNAMRALADKAKEAFGQPNNWNAQSVRQLGPLLSNFDAKDIRNIPLDAINGSLDILGDQLSQMRDAPGKRQALARQMIQSKGGVNQAGRWDADDIANLAPALVNNRKALKKLNKTALAQAMANGMGNKTFDPREARYLAKRVLESDEFKNPENFDAEKVKQLGGLLPALGKKDLKKIPKDALLSNLDQFKNADFDSKQSKRVLLEKIGLNNLDAANIQNMGKMFEVIRSDEMKDIPASAIKDSLSSLKDMEFDRAAGKELVKLLKSADGNKISADSAKDLGKLIAFVSLKDTKDIDFGLDNDSVSLDIEPRKDQAFAILESIKNSFGEPGNDNDNFTSSLMDRISGAAAGFSPKDVKGLKVDSELPSLLESISELEDKLSFEQTKEYAKKVLEMDMESLSESEIAGIGKFAKHLNISSLERVNITLRQSLAEMIGKAKINNLKKDIIKTLAKFALKYVENDNGEIEDKRSGVLNVSHIGHLGKLAFGLEKADIKNLDESAIEGIDFENMPFEPERAKEIFNRIKELYSDWKNDSEVLVLMGPYLPWISADDYSKLDKDAFAVAYQEIAAMLEEKKRLREERDDAGLSFEVSDDERDEEAAAEEKFHQEGQQAMAAVEASKRRRRSADVVTCDDITAMGSGATALTTDLLNTLTSDEFLSCLETLGDLSGWNSSQLTTLATKAKTALGSPDTWTNDELMQAGAIVAGLTAAEIDTLKLNSTDVMEAIGKHNVFDVSQLVNGFKTWLSLVKSGSMSAVTAEELSALNNFACGATDAQIQSLTNDAYTGAAYSIGLLKSCETSQLQEFGKKAKSAYGSTVSNWEPSILSNVGHMLGGLDSADLQAFTSDQMAVISPSVIANLPPLKFAEFTVAQLGSLSENQASSVTASQQSALSAEKLSALTAAGAPSKVSDNGAGGGGGNGGNGGGNLGGGSFGGNTGTLAQSSVILMIVSSIVALIKY